MKHKINISVLILLFASLSSCSDFFDLEQDNTMTEEEVFANAAYFCGPLMDSYSALPGFYNIEFENMTDNAVDNDFSGDYYICGTGALRPDNNPLNNWETRYKQIRNINIFLSKMVLDPTAKLPTPVRFYVINNKNDSIDNVREFQRLLGEAYFMRSYWLADLLRNFGGEAKNGSVLGVPLVEGRILNIDDNLNIPRAAYDECVQAIVNDCDSAIKYLPVEYKGTDRVIGASINGRAAGISAMALKARILLYAASPAFNKDNDKVKWEKAAIAAGEAIKAAGGLSNLSKMDDYYFAKLNNKNYENRDILFRGPIMTGNQLYELNHYPQSMYGAATSGASQNYVDAFPDKDGYPLSESSYDYSANPFQNRDPRLALFVGYNGSKMGPGNYYTIESYEGGADAYVPLKKTSRTSYYIKKLLRTNQVQLIPGNDTKTQRANIILGMPELYLNYAEAANEAWGVKSDPRGFGFTANDALKRILAKYGSGEAYLNNVIGADGNKFRAYLRNERRLELSFEGHYFYDLRRWIGDNSVTSLNVDVYGMKITKKEDNTFSYEKILLEKRRFLSPYQPIPYMELYNAPSLVQNYGWQ